MASAGSTTAQGAAANTDNGAAIRASAAPAPSLRRAPVATSRWEWRLEGGVGAARERVRYAAAATVANPQPGYASTTAATTASASTTQTSLELTALHGAGAESRPQGGLRWGLSLALGDYATDEVALPVADADVSASSSNGRSFTSRMSLQSAALGLPLGWGWSCAHGWSLEGLAIVHLGIMHVRYTSGENEVFGRNAPLGLYRDSLYNLYYDLGAQVHVGYRGAGPWEAGAGLGYRWGRSLTGSHTDQVVYYQGAANPQPGSYQERLSVEVSTAYLVIGCSRHF